MKRVAVCIQPSRLEDVKDALDKIGVKGMTVSTLNVCDHNLPPEIACRSKKQYQDFIPKVHIELITKDNDAETVITTILESAKSNASDEEELLISNVENVVRIRTTERNNLAL